MWRYAASLHTAHIYYSHSTTPLFALFKVEYQNQLMRINRILSGHRMTRIQFFRVLVPAYAGSMAPEAIRSGFRNTGIYPPNKGTEKLKQISASDVYDKCKSIVGLGYVNVRFCRFFVL